jgi:DNA-binding GntR family transcriptional regulator
MKIELVSANDKAYEVLLEEILSRKRRSGDRLTIENLANELGISSTPIRDALKRLESEGIVTVIPRSGTFVSLPSVKDVRDLFHFRIAIEKFAISLALPKLTDKHLKTMREAIARARSAQKERVFVDADREFHDIITACADNSYLTWTAQRIDRQLRFIGTICATNHSFDNKVLEDHLQIVDALATRDLHVVTELLENHIRFVLEEILELWPNTEE